MFSIQFLNVFLNFFGKNLISSFITELKAGSEIFFIFKNHCFESLGSIIQFVLSDLPIFVVYGSLFFSAPIELSSFIILFRASNLSNPEYCKLSSFRDPSSFKMSTISNLCLSPINLSFSL